MSMYSVEVFLDGLSVGCAYRPADAGRWDIEPGELEILDARVIDDARWENLWAGEDEVPTPMDHALACSDDVEKLCAEVLR